MVDEDFDGAGPDEGRKRRSTYTPPPKGAPFPERLGELGEEDIQRAKQASEKAATRPSASPSTGPTPDQATYQTGVSSEASSPEIPPAPVRSSLGDGDIMAKFQDGSTASTEEMMGALEDQLALRAEENQRFADWESEVRSLLPAEEAEPLIESSRRAYDGLAPLPEATPDTADTAEAEEAEVPAVVGLGVSVGTDTVAIQEPTDPDPVPAEPDTTESEKERWFAFDRVGIEPAADINRTSGALKLFWTWWSTAIPFGGIIVGAWLIASGDSVVGALIATFAGVALGSLPLIVGTVVGARSGLPALIASRAAFGLVGNIAPAALLVIIRFAVVAFFVWAAVWVAGGILVEANLWLSDRAVLDGILAAAAIAIVGALVVLGRRYVTLMVWFSGVLSVVAAVGLVLLTGAVPTRASFLVPGVDVGAVIAGASFVAAMLMIFWAQSGTDVARFAHPSRAAHGAGLVAVAAIVPPAVFIGWGALLAGANANWQQGLIDNPIGQVLAGAPVWYPVPAIIVLALPLLGLAALAGHSSSYALMSVGIRMTRLTASVIVTVVTAAAVFAAVFLAGDVSIYLVDAVRIIGVVVAAWVGVFVGQALSRRSQWDQAVLLGTSGSFPAWRIAPLAGFVVAIGLGWGFTTTTVPAFAWLGYLTGPLTQIGLIDLGPWQLGVVVSLVVAAVVAVVAALAGNRTTPAADTEVSA